MSSCIRLSAASAKRFATSLGSPVALRCAVRCAPYPNRHTQQAVGGVLRYDSLRLGAWRRGQPDHMMGNEKGTRRSLVGTEPSEWWAMEWIMPTSSSKPVCVKMGQPPYFLATVMGTLSASWPACENAAYEHGRPPPVRYAMLAALVSSRASSPVVFTGWPQCAGAAGRASDQPMRSPFARHYCRFGRPAPRRRCPTRGRRARRWSSCHRRGAPSSQSVYSNFSNSSICRVSSEMMFSKSVTRPTSPNSSACFARST